MLTHIPVELLPGTIPYVLEVSAWELWGGGWGSKGYRIPGAIPGGCVLELSM